MNHLQRRNFLKLSSALSLAPALSAQAFSSKEKPKDSAESLVNFTSDGLNLSPLAYSQLLTELTKRDDFGVDNYSLNGCVEELETQMAKILGKEAAVFMPTGTLANHLAIRTLAGKNNRVILQHESHVYNDTGDCAQTLSNLNLIPLGFDKATFTVDEVNEVLKRTAGGRVASKVGVISIESPVRRKTGELFDYEQMKQISALAKSNDIKMHLDGARLFLASGYTGISPATYASLFDTVYISLYKYFNAASGAILAGPKELIASMYHARRMFGGGLHQVWPYAAVALHYLEDFSDRYSKAVSMGEELIKKLDNHDSFEIQRITKGTNIFKMTVQGIAPKAFAENLNKKGIIARPNETNGFNLLVNESLLKSSVPTLVNGFVNSLK
ncbi:low specificity L-threonine aldolase [Emticicia sp. C21]|uniref:threonine aldolase family protein n=1 Tax=Emticicia sp. C21 TaxID=2302915 RepID=UPI000E356EBA|nr:aminotransferase class I/II-fold pyridoxal phosphate-dependent enzyme [Emticicia sp. C21]RFS16341.1 aminotransferase class I/II-fold pyridoxal phosphate-dependent enzyme [Emticicia sp. C21]